MRKTILATASSLAISIVPALAAGGEMPGAPVRGGGGHHHGYGGTGGFHGAHMGGGWHGGRGYGGHRYGGGYGGGYGYSGAIGALTAPGFRGPLAGPFSAGPSLPGADARTDITWRATTPATPTDISSAGLRTHVGLRAHSRSARPLRASLSRGSRALRALMAMVDRGRHSPRAAFTSASKLSNSTYGAEANQMPYMVPGIAPAHQPVLDRIGRSARGR